ncbi:MAG TPA: hypothetical protein VK714_07780 [Myxococcota bacterium]|nr:hypothetical protein [Myxococcota bacterium]
MPAKWGGPRLGAGRPPLPVDERRTERVVLMVTADELATLKRRAAARHLPPSTLAYQLLAPALRRTRRRVPAGG